MASTSFPFRQRGAGILETMVGILIGLLVVLVVYNLLAVAEGYRRTTEGASDAQITGLMSQFLASRDAGNGGNGIALSAPDLIQCNPAVTPNVLPVPVLVTRGGTAFNEEISDSFIATYSGSPHVVWPVDFTAPAPAGSNFTVQTITGFSAPIPTPGTPYWVVAMPTAGTAVLPRSQNCELLQVSAATAPDPFGQVVLTLVTANANPYVANQARLLNLGPVGNAGRIRYEVWNTTTASACGTVAGAEQWRCQLFTTELLTTPPALPQRNPVAQNIVLMKVQYGVDTDGNDQVDCWTPADASTCGDFSMANVRDNFTVAQINQILAVRIGVVVRSDEPDFKDTTLVFGTRAPVVLFDCSFACPGRVIVPNAVIEDQWRFRTYETVVPLRNALFNATLPP